MNEADDVARAVECLVSYWRQNPHAADGAEGISRWWLGEAAVSRQALDRALQRLVSEGRVIAATAADGRVRYRWSSMDNG